MPKRTIEIFVVDILLSIDRAKRYSQEHKTIESFIEDEKSYSAALRELEIIGEAMKYIINHKPFNHLVEPRWRIIIDFRNIIAHDYFGLRDNEVFKVLNRDLIAFEGEFLSFLNEIRNADLYEAFETAKEECMAKKHKESIKYLNSIVERLKI